MPSILSIRERLQDGSRLRRILHGAFSAFVGKGVSLLIGLVTVPVTLRYLGRVEYGIWITISTTVLMLGVLDLGIASTLTNYIAKANANEDRDAAREYYATAFFITIAISIVLAGIFYLVWRHVEWGGVFGVHDPLLSRQAGLCVGIAVLFFLFNLPLTLASRVLSGYQQIQIANYFAMASSVLTFAAIIGGIAMHFSIVGLMMLFCCGALAGNLLLNLWLIFHNRPWIRPQFQSIRVGLARDLFGEGSRFFILQLCGLVVYNSDNLVITHYLGAAEVTPYSVTGRLMSCATTLHTLLIPVLWPAFSDAFYRNDLVWVRRAYNRVAYTTVGLVAAVAIFFGFAGQWIIRHWATSAAVPPQPLLWTMVTWVIILTISTNQSCLLAATQRIGMQAVTSTVAAIFNLVASIYLVKTMGTVGVVLATISSYLIFVIGPQAWQVRSILNGPGKLEPAAATQ